MTGCGKSTLLQALIYGSDTLQEIETKKGLKKVIDSKMERKEFKIGHQIATSETFYPSFYHSEESQLTFVDLPGLEDTQRGMVELINEFMSTKIYTEAKSVRFLLPISF